MGIFAAVASALKVLLFFLNLWKDRNSARAKKKAEIAKEIVDAFAETDKKKQASKLNIAIGRINRMR